MTSTSNSILPNSVQDSEMYKMHTLISIIDRMADEILNNSQEISYSQLVIMFVLDKHQQMSQKELSKCLGLTEAAVSKQIENMFVKNYLVRQSDPTNRRKNNIFLTDSGKKIFLGANQHLVDKAEDIFKVLNHHEREIFNTVLDKLLTQTNALNSLKKSKTHL